MKIRYSRFIIGLFLFCIAFVSTIVVVTYNNMNRAMHESKDVSQSLQSLRSLENIYIAMQNVETGYRGFLLTNDKEYLDPYYKGIASINKDTIELFDKVDNSPLRPRQRSILLGLVKRHVAIASDLIEGTPTDLNHTRQLSKLSLANKVMDSIRDEILLLENEDRAILQSSNSLNKTVAQRTNNLFLLLAVSFGTIMVISFYLLLKSIRRRLDSEKETSYLASLVNQTFDAILSTDENSIIKSWNKAAEKMYGYSREEVLGKSVRSVLNPIISTEAVELAKKNIAAKKHHVDEFDVARKDGTRFPIWGSITAMMDGSGKVTGFVIVNKDISERKKLEDQLRKFNEDLEQQVKTKTREITEVFDRVSDAFVALDKKWFFTYANRKAEELFNFPVGFFINKKMEELFPEAVNTSFYQASLEALEKQEMKYVELYTDKYEVWLEIHIYPSENGLSIYLRDITQRKKAESELFLAHQRLAKHIDNTPLAIVEWDNNMKVSRWSSRAEEIFGWKKEEMIGADISQMNFIYQEDAAAVISIIDHLIKGEKSINRSINRNYTKNGDVIYCEWYASVLRNEGGEVIALLGLVQDITHRIKATEAIEKANERFRLMATTTNDAIWEWNLENHDAWGNEVHQQLYGLTLNDPVPDFASWKSRIHPEDRDKVVTNMDKVVANPERNTYFSEYRFKIGEEGYRYIYDRTYIVRNTEGKAIRMMGNMMDITENKMMEEQIRHTSDQLRQLAGRLQEIREEERLNISREIHDELGQQLSVLKMDVSWLNRKLKHESPETLEKIKETLALLDSTIKSVRRIASNLRPGVLDDLGLVAALEWQSREIQNRTGLKIEFLSNVPDMELPTATATALFRIFQESITNVVRHANAKNIVTELILENNLVTLTITDDGQGFDTSKMETTGTLGILGMRERTLKLKGEYIIKSNPGKGTTVRAIVPLTESREPINHPI